MASPVQFDIEESIRSFRWNEGEYDRILNGPQGAVAKELVRRGILVMNMAKRNASHRPGPNVRTGRLRGSITWRLSAGFGGMYVDVGTNVEYAPYLEFGTVNMPPYPFLRPALEAARASF